MAGLRRALAPMVQDEQVIRLQCQLGVRYPGIVGEFDRVGGTGKKQYCESGQYGNTSGHRQFLGLGKRSPWTRAEFERRFNLTDDPDANSDAATCPGRSRAVTPVSQVVSRK
jgi:hypothetical protein